MPIKQRAAAATVKQSLDNTSIMKVLFAVYLVLLPMLAMGQEEDRGMNSTDISERQRCYVPGQCQEYSVNFKRTDDVDLCHKFCGQNEDCGWWSFEPSQNLCLLFANCTEAGPPDTVACEACISGERLCPPRECHGAFKCQGIFIDSFEIDHLEDCLKACSDNSECMWFTLEKTHNHCILYEGCEEQQECETCASGERECSAGYHGPTPDPETETETQCGEIDEPCDFDEDCCGDNNCSSNSYICEAPEDEAGSFMDLSCMDDGSDCSEDADCCSQSCIEDFDTLAYQCAPPPAGADCAPPNEVCNFDDDCCEGDCQGGLCEDGGAVVSIVGGCQMPTEVCAIDTDCCKGDCQDGVCGGAECKPLGGSCTSDAGCCGDNDCNTGSAYEEEWTCEAPAPPCVGLQETCSTDAECCEGECFMEICCSWKRGYCEGDDDCCGQHVCNEEDNVCVMG